MMKYQRVNSISETKLKIFIAIANNKSATKLEISDITGLTTSTINYHMDYLLHKKLISSVRLGKCFYYYPTGDGILYFGIDIIQPKLENIIEENILTEKEKKILKYLKSGKKYQKDIKNHFNISKQMCSVYLNSIVKKGFAKKIKYGREYMYAKI
jgi:predicted transcriptional regulator